MGYGRIIAFLILFKAAGAQTVVVHPKLIQDVLVNPGMGIQTFQRFNGDALNTGVKWSEEGPIESLAASGSAVDFPPSTIAYCRWFWETLEPEQGKVGWEIIDRALADAARHGQALAIRLMPYEQKHPLPHEVMGSPLGMAMQLAILERIQGDSNGNGDAILQRRKSDTEVS